MNSIVGFTDEQVSGPFASWVHRHIVRASGPALPQVSDAELRVLAPVGDVPPVAAPLPLLGGYCFPASFVAFSQFVIT